MVVGLGVNFSKVVASVRMLDFPALAVYLSNNVVSGLDGDCIVV